MSFLHYVLMILMLLTAFFLIILILIQRGKGGGLAGAFGGMGGQSAFGTKAGDLFTRITIGVAFFWIVLCILGVRFLHKTDSLLSESGDNGAAESKEGEGGSKEPGPTGEGGGDQGPESGPSSGDSAEK